MLKPAIFLGSLALACGAALTAAQAAPSRSVGGQQSSQSNVTNVHVPPAPKPLLPEAFDGWVQNGKPTLTSDPGQADPANAQALREYGFAYAEIAEFKRDGTETLNLRALHFEDVSGAYGAYSFYRPNQWTRQNIGDGAASDKNRVLFRKGNTVVDANFSNVGPMTAGELRSMAKDLAEPTGNRDLPPPILAFLPQTDLDHQSTHYAEGPAGYAGGGGVLPPSLVDFSKDAETVTADYTLSSGPATLTILSYPTPQIAMAQEAKIREYIKAGAKAQPQWTQALTDSDQASLEVRRSGVLVTLVTGDAIPEESHRLLEMVHYEANLTSVPQPTDSEVAKTGRLLFGIAAIVTAGSITAILLGFFLGGGRALWRVAHGKPASSVYDEEFVHLDLRERLQQSKGIQGPNPNG